MCMTAEKTLTKRYIIHTVFASYTKCELMYWHLKGLYLRHNIINTMVRIPSFQPRIAFVSAWIENQLHHSRNKNERGFSLHCSRVIRNRIIFFVMFSCLVFHCLNSHLRPSSPCLSVYLSLSPLSLSFLSLFLCLVSKGDDNYNQMTDW